MTDNKERQAFEAWANDMFYSGLAVVSDTWNEERGMYSDYAHHMAWHAYRAALAASQDKAEPVAVVGSGFALHWVGSGPITPIVERYGISVGSLLYPEPQPSAAAVRDAALEEAAAVTMKAPITAGMSEDKSAQALAFHASARIRALKSAPPQPVAATLSDDERADMFWDESDPERPEDSIHNVVVEALNNGGSVGEIVEIQRAIRLSNVSVRITSDQSGEIGYEYIDAPPQPAEQPSTSPAVLTDEVRVLIHAAIHHCQMSSDMAAHFTANKLRVVLARAQGEQA